jgi:hypothetical protein
LESDALEFEHADTTSDPTTRGTMKLMVDTRRIDERSLTVSNDTPCPLR